MSTPTAPSAFNEMLSSNPKTLVENVAPLRVKAASLKVQAPLKVQAARSDSVIVSKLMPENATMVDSAPTAKISKSKVTSLTANVDKETYDKLKIHMDRVFSGTLGFTLPDALNPLFKMANKHPMIRFSARGVLFYFNWSRNDIVVDGKKTSGISIQFPYDSEGASHGMLQDGKTVYSRSGFNSALSQLVNANILGKRESETLSSFGNPEIVLSANTGKQMLVSIVSALYVDCSDSNESFRLVLFTTTNEDGTKNPGLCYVKVDEEGSETSLMKSFPVNGIHKYGLHSASAKGTRAKGYNASDSKGNKAFGRNPKEAFDGLKCSDAVLPEGEVSEITCHIRTVEFADKSTRLDHKAYQAASDVVFIAFPRHSNLVFAVVGRMFKQYNNTPGENVFIRVKVCLNVVFEDSKLKARATPLSSEEAIEQASTFVCNSSAKKAIKQAPSV